MSFFFSAGETTFIVGRSGSGKSTIGNLLMLYYDIGSGEINIDGNSIQTLDISWLRNNVTLVQQQSVLFNETLFTNIAFGHKNFKHVTKEEVRRCLQTAYLQHAVSELPKGLDTLVGTCGSALSGGQKQRVSIARARLRDTPILIIDEGTSALDHISKTMVMGAIRSWRKGKTTILITHDISQIEDNDFVYVMEEGRIVQEGFRHALEKSPSSAFERLLQPEVIFPLTNDTSRRPSNPSDEHLVSPLSSLPSIESVEMVDSQFRPRRRFVPSVFGSLPEDNRSRTNMQGLVSPLSPAAFPMHRISLMSPGFIRQGRKNSQSAEPLDLPPSNIPLVANRLTVDFSLTGLPATAHRMSVVGPSSRPGSLSGIERASIASRRSSMAKSKINKMKGTPPVTHMRDILYTVWPTLLWQKRVVLVFGFSCAAIHAVATPMFSWVFAKLLGTFFAAPNERAKLALTWSLSVLGVAIGDSVASYYMHYLLECCGQAWVDALRVQAMKRVLDQPREWFDRESTLTELTESLDRNAEEMRNLLGRFAAFVFVAILMLTMALVWSLVLCWKLTLVSLASLPFVLAVTQLFETVSGKWEGKSNDAGAVVNSVFMEIFGQIRTVRALTLEDHFHQKYVGATSVALRVGMKRSSLAGFFFGISESGIIFITGEYMRRRAWTLLTICSTHVLLWFYTCFVEQIQRSRCPYCFHNASVQHCKCYQCHRF